MSEISKFQISRVWIRVFCSHKFLFLRNSLKIFVLTLESFSQIKKEKSLGDACKGEPMDTASSSMSSASATDEDKKPEVKKEPKEEEEGSGSTGPNSSPVSTQSKKKSKL